MTIEEAEQRLSTLKREIYEAGLEVAAFLVGLEALERAFPESRAT